MADPVDDEERRLAARVRLAADKIRGVATPAWIAELAQQGSRPQEIPVRYPRGD